MHTPGPWRAEQFGEVQWAVKTEGEWDFICTTSQGNDEDNAILIAGAPDMFAALEAQERADKAEGAYRRAESGTPDVRSTFDKWVFAVDEAKQLRTIALDKVRGDG